MFIGATIHDVAQVVGAGYAISPEAGDTATVVKLMRVAMLLPVIVAVGLWARREGGHGEGERPPLLALVRHRLRGAGRVNSLVPIPDFVRDAGNARVALVPGRGDRRARRQDPFSAKSSISDGSRCC